MSTVEQIISSMVLDRVCRVSDCETCREIFKDYPLDQDECPDFEDEEVTDQEEADFMLMLFRKMHKSTVSWNDMSEDELFKVITEE